MVLNGVYMGSQWCEMGSTWGPCGVNWGPVGHIWGSMGSVWIPYGLHVGLNAATRCKRRGGGAVRPTGVWGGGRAKAWNGRRGRARAAGAALWGSRGGGRGSRPYLSGVRGGLPAPGGSHSAAMAADGPRVQSAQARRALPSSDPEVCCLAEAFQTGSESLPLHSSDSGSL